MKRRTTIATKDMLMVALVAALTAVGGWLSIPLKPVPFTLQVFFVLLAGMVLGPNLGALSQIVYVLLGVVGLPVFANGASGPGTLVGPTGGYLIGFVVGSYVVGLLHSGKDRPLFIRIISPLVGLFVIYLFGAVQLSYVTGFSPVKALAVGVAPFILFDLIKAVLAAIVADRLKAVGYAFGSEKAAAKEGAGKASA